MQRANRVAATLAALASPLLAQFDIEGTFVAATELRCSGQVPFFWSEASTLPRGTDLVRGAAIGVAYGTLRAAVRVTWSNDARRVTAVIHEEVVASGPHAGAWTGGTTAPHETLLTLRAPAATTARLVVTSAGSGSASTSATWARSASVDVDDDGTEEVVGASGRYERIVTFGAASPLTIRTRTQLGAGTSNPAIEARGTVTIEILPLPAVVATHVAATNITAYAGFAGAALAAGSMLAPGALVRADHVDSAGFTAATTTTADQIVVRIDETGVVGSLPMGGSVGPHDTMLTLRAEVPRLLHLALAATSFTGPPGTSMHVGRIDVGDDGSFELTSVPGRTVRVALDLVVGPGPLRVRTRSSGNMGPTIAPFAGSLSITVTPVQRCTVTGHGNTCVAGSHLSAVSNLDADLQLDLAQAPPYVVGKAILGVAAADLPLPFSRCRLHVDPSAPFVLVPFQTDRNGRAFLNLALPLGSSFTFFAQDLLVAAPAPLTLVASNALQLDCR